MHRPYRQRPVAATAVGEWPTYPAPPARPMQARRLGLGELGELHYQQATSSPAPHRRHSSNDKGAPPRSLARFHAPTCGGQAVGTVRATPRAHELYYFLPQAHRLRH
jgi:hypothetical protein